MTALQARIEIATTRSKTPDCVRATSSGYCDDINQPNDVCVRHVAHFGLHVAYCQAFCAIFLIKTFCIRSACYKWHGWACTTISWLLYASSWNVRVFRFDLPLGALGYRFVAFREY